MCLIPQEETSREPCLRDPHAKSKKSPFSWPGELSGLTCHAAYSGGWSCRRHSGFRLIYKAWERNIVPETLSGQGLVFIPYLEVNYSPLWSWGKSTFRRWACDGALLMISQVFVGHWGIALERKGLKECCQPACWRWVLSFLSFAVHGVVVVG